MKQSIEIGKIMPALLRAKQAISALPLVKDRAGDKAKYLQLSTLLAAVEPVLLKNEIVIVQGCAENIADGLLIAIRVETTLVHVSGEWIASDVVVPVSGPIIKGGGRADQVGAQDGGISITYGKRYSLAAILSISVDDDTDGAAKQQSRRKRSEEVADRTAERMETLKIDLAKKRQVDVLNDTRAVTLPGKS